MQYATDRSLAAVTWWNLGDQIVTGQCLSGKDHIEFYLQSLNNSTLSYSSLMPEKCERCESFLVNLGCHATQYAKIRFTFGYLHFSIAEFSHESSRNQAGQTKLPLVGDPRRGIAARANWL